MYLGNNAITELPCLWCADDDWECSATQHTLHINSPLKTAEKKRKYCLLPTEPRQLLLSYSLSIH